MRPRSLKLAEVPASAGMTVRMELAAHPNSTVIPAKAGTHASPAGRNAGVATSGCRAVVPAVAVAFAEACAGPGLRRGDGVVWGDGVQRLDPPDISADQ